MVYDTSVHGNTFDLYMFEVSGVNPTLRLLTMYIQRLDEVGSVSSNAI